MMSIKSSFGFCRKSGDITNQVIGTKNEIVPGTLLKIILVNNSVISDRFDVIKIYDRNAKRFGKGLFQCDKANIQQLNDNVWLFVSKLTEGDNITLNLEMPDTRVNVNFCIKYIGEVPECGPGVFYTLNLINNPKLSDYNKYLLEMKYSVRDKSTMCIRGDRLIESLQPVQSCVNIDSSTNYSSLQSTSANSATSKSDNMKSSDENSDNHMLNVPELSLIDFDTEVQCNQTLIDFEVPPLHCYINETTVDLRSNNSIDAELINLSNDANEYARIHNEPMINQFDQDIQIGEVRNHSKVPAAILNKISNHQNSSVERLENYTTLKLPVVLPEEQISNQTTMDHNYSNSLSNLLNLQNESNGMNEYASWNNQHNLNVFYQRVLPNTNQVVKDFRLNEASNIVPASIAQKMAKHNMENSSAQANTNNYKQFYLPALQQDESPLPIDSQFDSPPPKSYVRQNSSPLPKNANKINKSRPSSRNHLKNDPNLNKITTLCYICSNNDVNVIQLNCQHMFCSRCLIDSFSNVGNAHCPYKIDNYKCTLKLGLDDIQFILDALKRGCDNSKILIMPRSAAGIANTRPDNNPVEKDVFAFNNNDSAEVIFYCKQNNCTGVWFVDTTERITIYMCPVCEKYNCFKCQAIHSNMSCEEYNQQQPARQNNKQGLLSLRGPNENQFNIQTRNHHKWKCEFCEYSDNLMDNAVCVICSRTNEKIQIENNNIENKSTWKCQFCTYSENSIDTALCLICLKTNENLAKTKKIIDTEYYRLLELEENDTFIPSFVEFDCIICAEVVKPDNGIKLRGCLHQICLICIRKYIEGMDQSTIKCPFLECTNILEDREIRSIVLPDVYERHLEKSLRIGKAQIQNGYQCCVTNCLGWWIFTKGIYEYNCPVCLTANCISCKASHPNIDCKTYQQNLSFSTDQNGIQTRLKLENMLRIGEAEHCPRCNVVVVKNGGCDVMHCGMCRTDFNWGRNPKRKLNIM